MPKTVILGAARTPIGKLGGGLSTIDATELGATAITAALERADVAPERGAARRHGPGPPGRPGPDPLAPGPDQGRDPQGGLQRDHQQGVRLGPARLGPARPGDPRGRRRGRRRRRHGVDVARALPAAPGALRLPHGRRQGARRDGPRRPHQPLQRAPDVRRGDRGRRRARAHAPRPRPLGAALARARGGRHRRGPPARGDRRGHRQGSQGRHRRRGRRGPAPRHEPRDAGQAARASWARRARTRRATRPASTTAAGRSCWPATSGPRPTARRPWPRSSPTRSRPTTSPTSPPRRRAPPRRRWPRPGCRPRTSTCGRSTRPSPRWRSTRSGCSASTRTRSTSTAARSPSGHPIGASGARILGALVHELRRRGGGLGCAAICSGGGQGDAVILKVHANGA